MTESQQRYCQLRRDVGLLRGELEGASGDQAELLSERLAETETEAELALVGPPNPEVEELAALWEELGRRPPAALAQSGGRGRGGRTRVDALLEAGLGGAMAREQRVRHEQVHGPAAEALGRDPARRRARPRTGSSGPCGCP